MGECEFRGQEEQSLLYNPKHNVSFNKKVIKKKSKFFTKKFKGERTKMNKSIWEKNSSLTFSFFKIKVNAFKFVRSYLEEKYDY